MARTGRVKNKKKKGGGGSSGGAGRWAATLPVLALASPQAPCARGQRGPPRVTAHSLVFTMSCWDTKSASELGRYFSTHGSSSVAARRCAALKEPLSAGAAPPEAAAEPAIEGTPRAIKSSSSMCSNARVADVWRGAEIAAAGARRAARNVLFCQAHAQTTRGAHRFLLMELDRVGAPEMGPHKLIALQVS